MSKSRQARCSCIKKKCGQPKVAFGLCHGGGWDYHPTITSRILGRRICHAWRAAGGDWDEMELRIWSAKRARLTRSPM